MKLTNEDVITLYRLVLSRDPEDETIVNNHCLNHSSIFSLLDSLLSSQEYSMLISNDKRSLVGNESKMKIDYSIDPQNCFERVTKQWNSLGESLPHWSVLTNDKYKNPTNTLIQEFYLEGDAELSKILNVMHRLGFDLQSYSTCIEYGCGLGRVTNSLSTLFEQVYAYDISSPHLKIAKKESTIRSSGSISYRHITSLQQLSTFPEVDFFYTRYVLQHNPPPLMLIILDTLMKSLKTKGIGFLQVPTYLSNYSFTKSSLMNDKELMDLHAVEQSKIFEILKNNSISLIDIFEDDDIGLGLGNRSNTIIVRKE